MIIKLIDGTKIRVPDDADVVETHASYNFMKPETKMLNETASDRMYFVIPIRNVMYIRVEGNTEGFEGPADLYVKKDKES